MLNKAGQVKFELLIDSIFISATAISIQTKLDRECFAPITKPVIVRRKMVIGHPIDENENVIEIPDA